MAAPVANSRTRSSKTPESNNDEAKPAAKKIRQPTLGAFFARTGDSPQDSVNESIIDLIEEDIAQAEKKHKGNGATTDIEVRWYRN